MNLKLTKRINKMRENLLAKEASICIERAKIVTEVYRENSDLPVYELRAKCLEETLRRMSIYIDSDTLIVGNQASKDRAAPIFPEYGVNWIMDEMDTFEKRDGDRFFISEEDKSVLRKILPFWEKKTLKEKFLLLLPDDAKKYYDLGIIKIEGNITSGDGHVAMAYDQLLDKGLLYYRDLAKSYREKLDLTEYENIKSYHFYNSFISTIDAVILFANRYADLAKEKAEIEIDEKRKKELLKIEKVCRKVPAYPAETFHEAVQFVWFIHLILQIESNGHSYSYGRLDQYLIPYYRKSILKDELKKEEALEILEMLCIRTLSINKIRSWAMTETGAGMPLYQNITIGGQTSEAPHVDATNEVSELILEAVGNLRLPQPNLTVRYHKNLSDSFMNKCIDVVTKGFGMPAFNNDEIIIKSLIEKGVEEKDAYDYSAVGCVEVAVPGKWGYRCTGMSFINFPRALMVGLNNGSEPLSDEKLFEGTGHFKNMKSFDDVMAAWEKSISEVTKMSIIMDNTADMCLESDYPDILCSGLTENCLERGKTLKEGGAKYDLVSGLQVGIANLGNSLAAIKSLVFEQNKINTNDLWNALLDNFQSEKNKKIQRDLLNDPHKYGNDDDYVDEILAEAYGAYIKELKQYHNTRFGRGPIGGTYFAGTSSISANVPHGAATMATPDGRNAGEPLAEGCSPSHGSDLLGPTSVFKSVSKLPTSEITGGVLLNQKLNPQIFENNNNKEKLVSVIRSFFDELFGFHVQFNVVAKETLIEAQEYPEKHRDLIVRVAGYSAFFNALSRRTQDDIIARTEQTL